MHFNAESAHVWWSKLEQQWKTAFNEALFGNGTTTEMPSDEQLLTLLNENENLRLAGPTAYSPNVSFKLTNLSGVEELRKLKLLSVTDMHIESIQELSQLTQLRHLFIYDNQIKSLKGIESLLELEELYFQNNRVSDLLPIQQLTKLKVIYATNNHIKNLEGLTEAHANELRKFYIQPNEYLPDREAIKLQNELGILARLG